MLLDGPGKDRGLLQQDLMSGKLHHKLVLMMCTAQVAAELAIRAMHSIGWQAGRQASERASERASKQARKQTSREASQQTSKEAGMQVSRQAGCSHELLRSGTACGEEPHRGAELLLSDEGSSRRTCGEVQEAQLVQQHVCIVHIKVP